MAQPSPYGGPPPGVPAERKSRTGLWVGLGCGCLLLLALVVGGIVLALTLMSGDDSKESSGGATTTTATVTPAPKPSQNHSGDDPSPSPNYGVEDESPVPVPAPNPEPPGASTPVEARGGEPQMVGDSVLVESAEPHQPPQNFDFHAVYQEPDGTKIEAGAGTNTDRDAATVAEGLEGAQKVGKWTCAVEDDQSLVGCVTQDDIHGYVAIASPSLDPSALAAWGDELLGALNEQQ